MTISERSAKWLRAMPGQCLSNPIRKAMGELLPMVWKSLFGTWD